MSLKLNNNKLNIIKMRLQYYNTTENYRYTFVFYKKPVYKKPTCRFFKN